MIAFSVYGNPAAQGSKRHVGNGVMVEMGKNHKPWRSAVSAAAAEVAASHPGCPLDGPVELSVTFRFPMPSSRKKAVREAGESPKTTAPDLDKLVRSVCDSLEAGGLLRNDARVCRIVASKVEVVGWTGAEIEVAGS